MSHNGNRQQIDLPDLQPCCDSELNVDLTTVLPWDWFIQIWKWRPHVLPKRPFHPPTLQDVVTRKTASWNIASLKILDESNKWTSTDVYSEHSGGLSLMRCFCTVFSINCINKSVYLYVELGSCHGCMKRVLTLYFARKPRNVYIF